MPAIILYQTGYLVWYDRGYFYVLHTPTLQKCVKQRDRLVASIHCEVRLCERSRSLDVPWFRYLGVMTPKSLWLTTTTKAHDHACTMILPIPLI